MTVPFEKMLRFVEDFLWKKRSEPDRDMFEETCNFIANTQEVDFSGIFNLPFDVPFFIFFFKFFDDYIKTAGCDAKMKIIILMPKSA